jgi:hypothetical protein
VLYRTDPQENVAAPLSGVKQRPHTQDLSYPPTAGVADGVLGDPPELTSLHPVTVTMRATTLMPMTSVLRMFPPKK